MKTHLQRSTGGHGLAASRMNSDHDTKQAPKIVIGALSDCLRDKLTAHFTKLGWRVKHSEDVVGLATANRAQAVVLPVQETGESAFLACCKLRVMAPKAKIVLVGPTDESNERFAEFVGAAGYVSPNTSIHEIADLIAGRLAHTLN